MKKSFMTRALAMGLSFAMAFSLSAATNVTTASAAAKKASVTSMMKVSSKTVTEGKKVTTYMNSTAAKKYRIKSHTESSVTKKYISVKMTDSRKGLTITAKEGALAAANLEKKGVYVKINFAPAKSVAAVKKAAATKYVKLKVAVYAAEKPEEKPEEPVEEVLALTGVEQKASNAVNVTFNKDASKDVTKDNVTIKSADGTAQLSVEKVEFSADGLSAKITVFGNFVDGTQYNVTYNSVDQPFTAAVGAVANVVISTTTAQQGVATPIEFSLFDATGVDVTPSISLDTTVQISVSGTYSSADVSKASNPKIIMANVGDTAEVTVTYNSNEKDAADFSAKGTITCVDTQAAQGNQLFAVNPSDINKNSDCAKFYLGLSDTTAKIALDATSHVYFCAKDGDDVIVYDSYEVESSNDNIVSASVNPAHNNGKFAVIDATANDIGSAQLTITASKNGKTTKYTIPVTTYKADVPVKMTLTIDKPVMSDSQDPDYRGKVTAQLLDADGNAVKADFTAKVIRNNSEDTPVVFGNGTENDAANATTEATFLIDASSATPRATYTIEVTGADNKNYTTPFTKSVRVTVKPLPSVLQNISYDLETTATADVAKGDIITAKMYATCDGLFAGYIDMKDMLDSDDLSHDTDTMIGGKQVATGMAIKAVTMSAIFGTKTFGENGSLLTTSAAVSLTTGGACTNSGTAWNVASGLTAPASKAAIQFVTLNAGGDGRVNTAETASEVARLGTYTIKFQYITTATGAKVQERTKTVTVKNSYPTPKVTVFSNKVDALNASEIVNTCLKTNVDMNNNISSHESIDDTALYDNNYGTVSVTDNKFIARYAKVEDNVNGVMWDFYVPINTTFTRK